MALDRRLDALLVGAHDVAQVLGIHAQRQRRRRDEVARQRRDHAALRLAGLRGGDEHLAARVLGDAQDVDQLRLECFEVLRRQIVLACDRGVGHAPAALEGVQRSVDGVGERHDRISHTGPRQRAPATVGLALTHGCLQ